MDYDRKTVDGGEPTLYEVLEETALLPYRLLLSKAALRAYARTILIVSAGLILYAIAVATYAYFYYTYIPNLRFDAPVHLQFSTHASPNDPQYHPHGLSALTVPSGASSILVSQQKYDVRVQLAVPRTQGNVQTGNFMLGVSLLSPSTRSALSPYAPESPLSYPNPHDVPTSVVAHSSRPGMLKYSSPIVGYIKKGLTLPMYLAGWREEIELLDIPMMEGVSFERGWRNVPTAVWIEIRSRERMQIATCIVSIKATLSGIRWLMYNHRIFSFLFFTAAFWGVEITTALFIWVATSLILAPKEEQDAPAQIEGRTTRIKQETDDGEDDADNLSDVDRTFPTYGSQPPLRYTSPTRPSIKEEDITGSTSRPGGDAEADISASDLSDEEADFVLDEPDMLRRQDYDSGLGTSMDSSAGSARRRRQSGRRSGGEK